MKKVMLLVSALFLLSLISPVLAIGFDKQAINSVIIKEYDQPAHFLLTLTDVPAGDYQFYTLTDVSLSPKGYFSLAAGTNTLDVYVYQTDELRGQAGYYTFTYNLKNYGGISYEDTMTIRLVSLADAIEIGSDTIDPDADNITFYIMNKEKAQLNNITASFSSVFFNDAKETFNLGPYQKIEFSIPINKEDMKKIKAGVYVIKGDFETDNGIKEVEGKIYLGEKKGVRTEEDVSGFFIRTDKITKTNTGNVPQDVEIVVTKNIITRLFTSFDQEPGFVDRNGLTVTYKWNQNLGPAEAISVKVKTNYIFPLVIIVLAILIIFIFKRFMQTKVEVRKSVAPVKAKGGELALRVSIRIKAKRNVENVSLIDRIPHLVKVYESFGIVKPTKVDLANRRIHWEIGSMTAGEERVVTYIIYSRVGVVGKFLLPAALAVFEKDGKIHEIESNNVFFLSEQTRRDD